MGTIQAKGNRKGSSVDWAKLTYGKIPPQSKELEEVILGAIMIESFCLPEVLNLIFADVFYTDSHQRIFKAIVQLYDKNQKVDISTVAIQLHANEELDIVGGAYYVTKLTNSVVSSANIEDHCRIVLQKYMAREMIRIGGEAINDAYEDSVDVFDLYDNADNQIINTQEKVMGGMVKDMKHYSGKVYEEYETVRSTGVLGIQTGIIPFDRIFCGLVPPDLIVIAARPGAGKTSLALSLTHHVSIVNAIPGAWFSLEMDGIQLTRRLVSIDSKLSHEAIRQGRLSNDEINIFYESLDRIKQAPIFIEDKSSVNIRSLRTRAHILVRKNKVKYIIVDYLQLMQGLDTGNKNRDTTIGEITRGLKGLAKELNTPIIALSQLSREVEKRTDKMPQLSDLRESGNIEQDADEVIFLMRPEYYGFTEAVEINKRVYNVSGLCIGKGAKNRHGSCQNFAMHFNAPIMHFSTHIKDIDFTPPTQNGTYVPYSDTDEKIF